MVDLRRFQPTDRAAVLGLAVTDAQAAFVEPVAETLSPEAPRRDCYVIEADGVVVGFFQIDSTSGAQRVAGDLELHEVSVGAQYQGRGYGAAFIKALKPFLQAAYPGWRGVCLTVNCRNKRACWLYEVVGFEDTGELVAEGRSGPQYVMRLALD